MEAGDRTPHHQLAIAAIFKNEARFLGEWIEYHHMVGVEHFWLYNDSSTDDWAEVAAPYLDAGLVEVHEWPVPGIEWIIPFQVEAYKDALRRARGRVRWLALIDLDEYLLPREDDTVSACLERHFQEAAAVYINWRNFGTGGVHLRRRGPILTHLTACSPPLHPDNGVGKSIVRPEQVLTDELWYAHHAILEPGARYYNGDGEEIPRGRMEPAIDGTPHDRLLRVNHYTMRDEAFFRSVRLPRFSSRGREDRIVWEHYEEYSREQDESIVTFIRDRHPMEYERLWGRPEEDQPSLGPYVSASVSGDLGNNLFQVAAASALAWDNGAEPVFPDLDRSSPRYQHVFFRCNVGPDPGDWNQWDEPSYGYSPIPFRPGRRIVGYFESERHFAKHRERLLDLFRPWPADLAYIVDRYGTILDREDTVGVSIHDWRADDPAGRIHPQYGASYLEEAAVQFPPSSLFVVSSNNFRYARDQIPPAMAHTLVLDDEPEYIRLFVLSACRNAIVGNSAFGWWAAWLNQHPDKVVVRPGEWVRGLPAEDVCPEGWMPLGADG